MAVTTLVGVTALKRQCEEGAQALRVDVRSASEYGTGHIPGRSTSRSSRSRRGWRTWAKSSGHIDLQEREARPDDGGPIGAMPAGGLDGGTDARVKAGFPVIANVRTRWSLERQVRLASGFVVVTASVLGLTSSVRWVYLAGFVGLRLTMAGLTDSCPMGSLLSNLSWNGARQCVATDANQGRRCG
jgi:hypothetical protein